VFADVVVEAVQVAEADQGDEPGEGVDGQFLFRGAASSDRTVTFTASSSPLVSRVAACRCWVSRLSSIVLLL